MQDSRRDTILKYKAIGWNLWLCGIMAQFPLGLYGQKVDSTSALIAPEYDKVGPVRRFWFGDSYRKLYNTPVPMRVVDLSTEKGGLQIVKLGGGMQTQSLRLVDPKGREWVLRSIQKYPERSLPENLRSTFIKDIVQDQISITHPFGALTVPPFNEALGIPHAKPELVYVGDDERLGEFRAVFKNRAYIFEPRMPFENEKTDNTLKVIRKVLEDNDTRVEQDLTLRARLLDMILGDWDRHEDNWRWDPEKEKGKKTYTPVPRDRDKVYYKTSGVFPVLLSHQWLKAHLQPFSPHIRNISHWNFNARHFDRFFLNGLNQSDWESEIKLVQETLTDSLIENAMLAMPDTIVKLSANELVHNIRSRRDEMSRTGIEYYKALAGVVDIPLSAKNEFIKLNYKQDGLIGLKVNNKKKDGTEGRVLLERDFLPQETKELRIYGIGGTDSYRIEGENKSPIKVRLIGGDGRDEYNIGSSFSNNKKLYLYDDKDTSLNKIPRNLGLRYRLSRDTAVHAYDYEAFVYDRKGVLVDVNYGIDRGLIMGLGYIIENQGFRKSPFAIKHVFKASYLTGRESFMLSYQGIAKSIWGKQDLYIDIESQGPFNLSNFFGYGNNTVYEKGEDRGIHYYRNRYDVVNADIALLYPLANNLRLGYGSSSTYFNAQESKNNGRFLGDYQKEHPTETFYGSKFFTGAKVGIDYDGRDNVENTKEGMHAYAKVSWQSEIGGDSKQHTYLNTAFSFYHTFGKDVATLANRTGLDAVWGDPYFFQHAQLGGEGSLRGFNSRRFTGKTMVYNNLEMRAKLFSYDSYLVPGTVGLVGFYDVGRVWMTQEKSQSWHHGYGGGVYFIPADLMLIQAAWGISNEAVLPYIRIGLRF